AADGLLLARRADHAEPGIAVYRINERRQHVVRDIGHQANLVRLQRLHHRLVPAHRAPGTRRVLGNASSVSPRKAATIWGFDTPLVRASFSRQKKLAP